MRSLVISLCLFAALASAPGAAAQQAPSSPEVLTQVYNCAAIESDSERLACFDAAVGRLRQAEQTGDFAAVDRGRINEVERESFGFRLPSLSSLMPDFGGNRDEIEDVQLVVANVVQRANGYHAFVMENGQVWVQVEPESARNVREGTTVTIRRAAIGSFMMSSSRGGSAHRVRREQ